MFPDTDSEEDKDAIEEVYRHNISDEVLISFTSRQNLILDDYGNIPQDKYTYLLTTDHIKPTWNNVTLSIKSDANVGYLLQYIIRHSTELSSIESSLTDRSTRDFLFKNMELSEFLALAPGIEVKFEANEVNSVDDETMLALLKADMLYYSDDYNHIIGRMDSAELKSEYIIKYFVNYLEDKNGITVDDSVGIRVLKSSLTQIEKQKYLEHKKNYSGDNPSVQCQSPEYAQLICELYSQANNLYDESLHVILDALTEEWNYCEQIKLVVVNKINGSESVQYRADTVDMMLDALAGNYKKLKRYNHKKAEFTASEENRKLLDYLDSHNYFGEYKLKYDKCGGKFKVSFSK